MGAHGSSYAPKPKGLSSVDILEDPFDALTLAHGGAFTPRTFQDLCGFDILICFLDPWPEVVNEA
jgi:hypothetical protein